MLKQPVKNEPEQFFYFIFQVQNAGFAFKQAATEPFHVQAEETFKINFWGTLNIMKQFYPLVRPGGRIVNVSSFTAKGSNLSKNLLHVNILIFLICPCLF